MDNFSRKYKLIIAGWLVVALSQFGWSQMPISALEAEPYLGKYKIENQQIVAEGEVFFENQDLVFFTEGIPKIKLLQLVELDKFKADKFEIILQFLRDEFRRVVGAKIHFQGQEFLAKKI